MIYNTFENTIKEFLDFSDDDTLHSVIEASNGSSANQAQMLTALTSKLYDLITSKSNKVDFSTIARSRGDFTKVENYNQIVECLDTMKNIVIGYKQNTAPVNAVAEAIDNLKSRTDIFKRAYSTNNNLIVMTYNDISLAIINSVSFLIATCIEFIKNPQDLTFQMALDVTAYTKTEHNLLFNNLIKFNNACNDGDMDKVLDGLTKNGVKIKKEAAFVPTVDSPFLPDTPSDDIDNADNLLVIHDKNSDEENDDDINESFSIAAIAAIASLIPLILKMLIPILRDLTYYWYFSKQKISDYFAVQADMLEMNAYELQLNSGDDIKKKEIANKQLKIVAKFRKISNFFSIDHSKAQKQATDLAGEEARKYVISDLKDSDNKGSYYSGHDGSNKYDPTATDNSVLF